MIENYFGLIEAIFVFGLAIAFYVWQRYELNRDNRLYEERKRREAESASATPPGHAEGQHGLDDRRREH